MEITAAKLHKPNWFFAMGLPLVVAVASFLITLTPQFKLKSWLISNAIVVDILVVAPLLYYLVIRKSNVAKLTVLRVFVLGLFFLGFILDAQQLPLLYYIKTFCYPIIEVVLVFAIIRSFYLANKRAKQENKTTDFLSFCRNVMGQVMGNEKIGNFFAAEIAMVYYAFFFGKSPTIDNKKSFSLHKESGIIALLATLLFVLVIETGVTHLLLGLWNEVGAWVATGLSLYTCLQLFAHIRAISLRPIQIKDNTITICNGLAAEASIDFDNIEKFELTTKPPQDTKAIKIALLKGLEEHNVVLYLKEPIQVTLLFGIKKTATTILFYADHAQDFSQLLGEKIR